MIGFCRLTLDLDTFTFNTVHYEHRHSTPCNQIFRLLKSTLPLGSLPFELSSATPFSFRLPTCSNVPLLFNRLVGVLSYSLPLYPPLDPPSSSVSAALGDPTSSYALYFRFCDVLGVSIRRRKRLSRRRLFTSSETSMCWTTYVSSTCAGFPLGVGL